VDDLPAQQLTLLFLMELGMRTWKLFSLPTSIESHCLIPLSYSFSPYRHHCCTIWSSHLIPQPSHWLHLSCTMESSVWHWSGKTAKKYPIFSVLCSHLCSLLSPFSSTFL
jgi:hypothetical protein